MTWSVCVSDLLFALNKRASVMYLSLFLAVMAEVNAQLYCSQFATDFRYMVSFLTF